MYFGFQMYIQFRLKNIVNILKKKSYSLQFLLQTSHQTSVTKNFWVSLTSYINFLLFVSPHCQKKRTALNPNKRKNLNMQKIIVFWNNISHVQLPKRWYLKFLVFWQATFKIGMVSQMKNVCVFVTKRVSKNSNT